MAYTLTTILALDMTGFGRGLKAATADLKSFQKDIGKPLAEGIGHLGKMAAGAVAAGAAFAGWNLHKISESAEELRNMHEKTGMSIESLSRWRYALGMTGSSLEVLDHANKGSMELVDKASEGHKEATETLHRMGLSYRDLKAMSPQQQFAAITDAVSKVKDKTTQSALAVAAFGRGGREMLPILARGKAGMAELARESDRLGATKSPMDVARATAFHDALYKVGVAFNSLTRSAFGLESITRALTAITNALVNLRNNQAFQRFLAGARDAAAGVISHSFGIAKAIYHLCQSSGESLLKWGALFGGVFLAFKLNLVMPTLRLAALFGVSLIKVLVSPFGIALAAIVGLFAAYKIGKVMAETFDFTTPMLYFMAGIKGIWAGVKLLGNLLVDGFAAAWDSVKESFEVFGAWMKGKWEKITTGFMTYGEGGASWEQWDAEQAAIDAKTDAQIAAIKNKHKGDGKGWWAQSFEGYDAELKKIGEQTKVLVDEQAAAMKKRGSFKDNLKKEWDETASQIKEGAGAIADAIIPDSLKNFTKDLGQAGNFKLPELNLAMPEIGADTERGAALGVERGLNDKKWGRVWTGGNLGFLDNVTTALGAKRHLKGMRQGKNLMDGYRSLQNRRAEQKLQLMKDTRSILQNMANTGVIVF